MSATLVSDKKLTVALKRSVIKQNVVIVVVAVKCEFESIEAKAIPFLGVALGFFDLSDHS